MTEGAEQRDKTNHSKISSHLNLKEQAERVIDFYEEKKLFLFLHHMCASQVKAAASD
jgi:hypothetical protein